MTTIDRPLLSTADARAVLAQTRDDDLLRAVVSLMLLVGLRPGEVEALRVRDYASETLHVGTERHPRTIRLASSAAAALDVYLATQATGPEDFLLSEARTTRLVQLARGAAAAAGVEAGVHDLRRAAVAVVFEGGAPVQHVEAYFGMGDQRGRRDLVPVRAGYDVSIAALLERTFAAPEG